MPDTQHIFALCGLLERNEIDGPTFFARFATALAELIGCSRAGVWMFVDEGGSRLLRCIAMYDATLDLIVPVEDIASAGNSAYLDALLHDDCVVATDARANPATVGFLHDYLEPLNIHSLLDVCFSVNGVPFGVFSCEQVGAPVAWSLRQLQLLRQIGSRASLTLMRAATASVDTAPGALWESSGTGHLPGLPPSANGDDAGDHPLDDPRHKSGWRPIPRAPPPASPARPAAR
jgi:GAF domain-containing protein